jgi:hypothetical protein
LPGTFLIQDHRPTAVFRGSSQAETRNSGGNLVAKRQENDYTSPSELKSFRKQDKSIVQVVIETPRGGPNKYKFEPKIGSFKLKKGSSCRDGIPV